MPASKTIEARLVLAAEGGDRSSAEVAKVVKAMKEAEKAVQFSDKVDRLAKSLEGAQRQARAMGDVMSARGPLEATVKNLANVQRETARLAREYDTARKAQEDFSKGQRFAKGSEQAQQASRLATEVKRVGDAHRASERDVTRLNAAFQVQTATLRSAEAAASKLGADLSSLERHQQSLARQTDLATRALKAQIAAEEMGASAAAARAQRSAVRREALGTVAAGAGVMAAAKGQDLGRRAVLSVVDFDYATREQQAFGSISKADQDRLLIPQAMQIGRDTKFSNTDIINAQTTVAQRLPKNLPRAEVAHAITQNVQYYAQALHADMKTSAESITAYLMATGKDMSTPDKARKAALRSTNILLQSAKLSGSDDNDLQAFTRFGVPAGHQAGFSDEFMGAFQAGMKRAGVGGDQAGTAMKTIAARLLVPTQKGAAAEAAAGIDRSKHTKMPETLSVDSMERKFRLDFGKSFTASQRAQLGELLNDPEIVAERERFVEEVSKVQMESFAKNSKGKYSAADQNKVAKKAGEFHKFNVENVDVQGLLLEILQKDPSLGVLNAIVTDKHGGKVGALSKMMEYFTSDLETLRNVPDDFGKKISDTITGGIGGSFEKLKGSVETFVLNIGRANEDLLKVSFDKLGDTIDKFSDLPQWAQQAITIGGAGAATAGGVYGTAKLAGKLLGFGGGGAALSGSAAALTKSAALLDAAAIKLAGGVPGAGPDKVKDAVKAVPLAGFGLGGVVVGLGAGAAVAGIATADQLPKIAAKEGMGAIDPGTGEKLEMEIPQTTPWLRNWLTGKPAEEAGKAAAVDVGKGLVSVPLPPPRPDAFKPLTDKAGEAGVEAGQKAGQGVADGVQAKAPEVEAQGKTLWQRLKDTMANPIFVPISFVPGEGMGGGGGGGGGSGGIVKAAYYPDGGGAFGGVRRASGGGGAIPGRNAFGGVDPLAGGTAVEPDGVSRSGGSRSWRNNNPGNIEYGPFARSMGATGTDGRFARFPSYEAGRRAQASLLFESKGYRNLTLPQAIRRWAPGSENNVPAYVRAMGAHDPNKRMQDYTPAERAQLQDAMQRHEGWRPGAARRSIPAASSSIPTVPDAPPGWVRWRPAPRRGRSARAHRRARPPRRPVRRIQHARHPGGVGSPRGRPAGDRPPRHRDRRALGRSRRHHAGIPPWIEDRLMPGVGEFVSLLVDGYALQGFQAVRVTRSAEAAAIGFTLQASNPAWSSEARLVRRGRLVEIRTTRDQAAADRGGGDLLCTGYVDDYEVEEAGSHREVGIAGRSKAGDAIDCPPAKHKTGLVENKDLLGVAKEFDEFGVGFFTDLKLPTLPEVQLVPGEPLFATLEREARHLGVLLIGQPDGRVKITRGGRGRHTGAFVHGQPPCERWKLALSIGNKRSPIYVRGQKRLGVGKDALRQEEASEDKGLARHRPYVLFHEGNGTSRELRRRAEWEQLRRSGSGISINLRVGTWRDEAGRLWEPGQIIPVQWPAEEIDQDFAIKSIQFGQHEGEGESAGTHADLVLVDPRTLGGKGAGKGSGSGAGNGGGKESPDIDPGEEFEGQGEEGAP